MNQAIQFELETADDGGETVLRLTGTLSIDTVSRVHEDLRQVETPRHLVVDMGGITRIDTAGAWVLCDLEKRLMVSGGRMKVRNMSAESALLIDSVRRAMPKKEAAAPAPKGFVAFLETAGKAVSAGVAFLLELTGYLGLVLARFARVIRHPSEFRLTALVAHSEDVGFRAVPIVALMSFLIGVVLAFQGSAQLQQFGAEVFVVDLIAHLHRADGRREGRSGATRDDDGRQKNAKLAQDRDRDQIDYEDLCTELLQLC